LRCAVEGAAEFTVVPPVTVSVELPPLKVPAAWVNDVVNVSEPPPRLTVPVLSGVHLEDGDICRHVDDGGLWCWCH